MESIAVSFDNDRILHGYVTSCPFIRQVENKNRDPDSDTYTPILFITTNIACDLLF